MPPEPSLSSPWRITAPFGLTPARFLFKSVGMDAGLRIAKDAKKFGPRSTGNSRQEQSSGGDDMQREMALLGNVKREREVPMELVKKCQTARQALALTVQWSGLKHAYIAESIGIGAAQFSRILSGQAHLDEDKRGPLMAVCGNVAMLQYAAWSEGMQLVADAESERIRQLEAELARAKGLDTERRQHGRRATDRGAA